MKGLADTFPAHVCGVPFPVVSHLDCAIRACRSLRDLQGVKLLLEALLDCIRADAGILSTGKAVKSKWPSPTCSPIELRRTIASWIKVVYFLIGCTFLAAPAWNSRHLTDEQF